MKENYSEHPKSSGKSSRVSSVLVLGTGGDNQSHVIRPRTANIQKLKSRLHRVSSGLETITEKQEEQIIMNSQGNNYGGTDFEESHSFSLRNFNQMSNKNLENSFARLGEASGLSNYSKIKADTQQ